MTPYFGQAADYLIGTVFSIYLTIVMLRALFGYLRVDFYNPISQFVVRATNPLLRPLRRAIPGFRGIDWAAIVLLLVLQILALLLTRSLSGLPVGPLGLLFLAIGELLSLLFKIFLGAVFIQVILSWFGGGRYSPLNPILDAITEPLLDPIRHFLPSIGGLDFSPLALIILLQLSQILLVGPILDIGSRLAV